MKASTSIRPLLAGLCCLALPAALLAQEPAVPLTPAAPAAPASNPVASVIRFFAGESAQKAGDPKAKAAEQGTHRQEKTIAVRSEDGKQTLQTLCVDGEGRVLGLVAPSRYYSGPAKDARSEVQVYSPEGKKLATWKVPFHAHSINTGPGGAVYVAGDGKVLRLDREGKEVGQIELPHVAELLKNREGMRKQAEDQLKAQKASYTSAMKRLQDLKEKLEAVPEAKRTALQKNQLKQYQMILESYKENEKSAAGQTVESILQGMTSRLRIINGVAVSEKDLFIACGMSKGYGYAVWRMGHDFKGAKLVLEGLGGCCGQMDIQVSGTDLLVAENTRHQFARYDRDGKRLGGFGKRGKDSEGDCFGGCCNPMNLTSGKDGDVYTAESEGFIKRFSAKGEFVAVVGHAPLTGGCKNVAVGVSPDGKRVYFCDQPGSRVIVLVRKAQAARSE